MTAIRRVRVGTAPDAFSATSPVVYLRAAASGPAENHGRPDGVTFVIEKDRRQRRPLGPVVHAPEPSRQLEANAATIDALASRPDVDALLHRRVGARRREQRLALRRSRRRDRRLSDKGERGIAEDARRAAHHAPTGNRGLSRPILGAAMRLGVAVDNQVRRRRRVGHHGRRGHGDRAPDEGEPSKFGKTHGVATIASGA